MIRIEFSMRMGSVSERDPKSQCSLMHRVILYIMVMSSTLSVLDAGSSHSGTTVA